MTKKNMYLWRWFLSQHSAICRFRLKLWRAVRKDWKRLLRHRMTFAIFQVMSRFLSIRCCWRLPVTMMKRLLSCLKDCQKIPIFWAGSSETSIFRARWMWWKMNWTVKRGNCRKLMINSLPAGKGWRMNAPMQSVRK